MDRPAKRRRFCLETPEDFVVHATTELTKRAKGRGLTQGEREKHLRTLKLQLRGDGAEKSELARALAQELLRRAKSRDLLHRFRALQLLHHVIMRSKHVRCLLLADDGGALFRDIMMSMLEKTEDCLDAERKVRSVNARNCRVYRARCERLAQYSGSASVANRDFEAEFAASAQHMDCEDQLSARMFLDTALRYLDEWEQHLRQRYPFVSTARTFLRTQHPACVARLAARSARKGATLRSLLAHYHNITPKYTQAFEHIISRCERMLATAVPNFDRHKQVSVERTGTDDDLFPSLFESDSDDEGETPQQQQKQQQQQSTESSIDVTQASFAEFLRGFALQADETVRVELAESQAFSALSQQQQAVLEKMAQRPLQVLKRVDRVLRRWAKLLTQLRLNHAKLRRLGFDSAHAAALHARCRQWQLRLNRMDDALAEYGMSFR